MGERGVFLQVRIGSSRLPEKALLTLAGKTVIEHAMEGLAAVEAEQFWLLTDEESEPQLRELARGCGFRVYVGDSRNVLKRYCDAAAATGVEIIVRATGDNPLVSATMANRALELQKSTGADYAGITGPPLGTGVEILRSTALQDLLGRTSDPWELEHVSPGLYRNPQRYRVETRAVERELDCPSFRVTLDTREDFQTLQALYSELYRGSPLDLQDVVAYGREQKKDIA